MAASRSLTLPPVRRRLPPTDIRLPEKDSVRPNWPTAALDEIATINPRRPVLRCDDDAPVTFVPMSAVAEAGAGITAAEVKPFAAVKKGYTYFAEGDVLFAKITPCMQNGKIAVVRETQGGFGFGSTEFHVLRPGPSVLAKWLYYFLIQPRILGKAQEQFTGAVGQQRVPDDFLRKLAIPLPPLPEQRRIAAKLEAGMAAVARARAAAQARLDAAERLPAAFLQVAFSGLDSTDAPHRPLGDLCSIIAPQVDRANQHTVTCRISTGRRLSAERSS